MKTNGSEWEPDNREEWVWPNGQQGQRTLLVFTLHKYNGGKLHKITRVTSKWNIPLTPVSQTQIEILEGRAVWGITAGFLSISGQRLDSYPKHGLDWPSKAHIFWDSCSKRVFSPFIITPTKTDIRVNSNKQKKNKNIWLNSWSTRAKANSPSTSWLKRQSVCHVFCWIPLRSLCGSECCFFLFFCPKTNRRGGGGINNTVIN